jgi:hypothetical protein
MKGQINTSIAQVKINFMKNEAKISELGSKASHRVMRDGNISVVGELIDGVNLMMQFNEHTENMSDELKGVTVNLRFSSEMFNALNARIHELGPIGALVQIEVDGNVEYGTLVVNGVQVESYTIYVTEIQDIEEVSIQRVGSRDAKDAVLARMREHKAANSAARDAAIQRNRPMLQTKAAQEGAAESTLLFQ